VFIS